MFTGSDPMFSAYDFRANPFLSQKKMYLFNARTEGKLNEENDPCYKGEYGIFKMPSFREPVKNKRCVIPVDFFVEGTTKNKLNEPYLVRRKDQSPFFLGGIWDQWVDKSTGVLLVEYKN